MAKKIILWFAVIFWMAVIFSFSAQPAVESDELSMGIAQKIFEFINGLKDIPVFSWVGTDNIIVAIGIANHYVRKTAHFMIFAILAVLVYNLMAAYGIKRSKVVLIAALVCLAYAVSDEIHQIFVPGRAGRIKDVLIDFSGSVSALGIIYLLFGRRAKCNE
ncbi:MAG: VanZ family protein [Clostridia bacterium]|nr:VanZ family protein [Clostridia bacterium]